MLLIGVAIIAFLGAGSLYYYFKQSFEPLAPGGDKSAIEAAKDAARTLEQRDSELAPYLE